MRKIIITLVMLLSVQVLFADAIYLNDGKTVNGRIIRITGKTIEYDPDGEIPFNIIKRESVSKIVYDNGLEVVITGDEKKAEPEGSERNKRGSVKLDEGKKTGREFDEIHLNDGTVYRGNVKRTTHDFIEFIPEGKKLRDLLPKGQVKKLIYKNGRVVIFSSPDPVKRQQKNLKKDGKSAEGFHEHNGFFFRFLFGYGYGKVQVDNYSSGDFILKGSNTMIRTLFGYSFADSLCLFIETGSVLYSEPDVKVNSVSQENTNTEYGASQTGLGISYYLMPINSYISISYYLAGGRIDGDLIRKTDFSGSGIFASFGKEWWVSENWGLGIAVYYSMEKLKVDDSDVVENYNIKNRFWGIAFSATYN